MSRMLASVQSLEEARIVLAAGVDLIDLKNPAAGALGALDLPLVRRIVKLVGRRIPVSATIGDLPAEPAILDEAIGRMSACGVDLVKAGIFADGIDQGTLRVMQRRSAVGTKIVLVFFAEYWGGQVDFGRLRGAGVTGVMLDTADKQGGPLTARLPMAELREFVAAARAAGLLTGLAGSLSAADARLLLPLGPDYLGFRGALCEGGRRDQEIDAQAVTRIRDLVWDGPASSGATGARTAA
jgi:uncharacterized protein (UPF0264 family)